MKPWLLLSLFITHLAVGGELPQCSIYVSADGTDNSSCLTDGGNCMTLGYVLSNLTMLQCSNCTIMVNYSHNVTCTQGRYFYSYNDEYGYYYYYSYDQYNECSIDISSITFLHIIGLGNPKPILDFTRHSLWLDNGDNITSVIIENIEFNNCYTCIYTHGIDDPYKYYYLLSFSMADVVIRNNINETDSSGIAIIAKNMYCRRSEFYNVTNGIRLYVPGLAGVDNEILVLDSTFENSHGSFLSFFYRQFNDTAQGSASITNNTIRNNNYTCTCYFSYCAFIHVQLYCDNDYCYINNNFLVTCTNNHFVNNFIHNECGSDSSILTFINWGELKMENSEIGSNEIANYAILINRENNLFLNNYNISIHNITFIGNTISSYNTSIADKAAIVTIQNFDDGTISMSDLYFTNNRGTPLSLVGSTINISGDLVFSNNTKALTGGGLYVSGGSILYARCNANITFTNNTAFFGGAIFVNQDTCFLISNCNVPFKDFITVKRNRANYGPDIFSLYNWCNANINKDDIKMIQSTFNIAPISVILSSSSSSIKIFPGKIIVLDMIVTDCFNNNSSCLADVYFNSTESRNFSGYTLQGPSTVSLHGGSVMTGLTVGTSTSNYTAIMLKNNITLSLQFVCKFSIDAHITVNVTLLRCPLGFHYNSSSKQCECAPNSEYFVCSKDAGIACVKIGYWYSKSSQTAIPCTHSFCDFSNSTNKCPSSVSSDFANFVVLSGSQCLDGHGGTLCTGCADEKVPTYGALMCIDNNECENWHPIILLLLNIILPFMNAIFLIVVVRLKLSIGSGYLYGPLFYLATLNLIPLGSYSTLNKIASPIATILLLQYQSLGYIPWCFFKFKYALFYGTMFRFLAPLIVAVVLLLTIILARARPKLFGWFQKSPLQAMCLLMLVSFWSLASTAILLLKPVNTNGKVHLNVNPDRDYFTYEHIPVGILSILFLLIMYSMVILLMISHFYNPFHKFKPVLDELQSCYKDRYRWYGGVYFIIWTILQVIVLTSNYQLFTTLIIVLTITHCLLQPYSKKWLNIMDGVLLGSLSISSSLVLDDSSTHVTQNKLTEVLVYISVLGPLIFIVCGIVLIIMVQFGITSKLTNIIHKISAIRKKHLAIPQQTAPQKKSSNITHGIVDLDDLIADTSDREPLVAITQESMPSSDYVAMDES